MERVNGTGITVRQYREVVGTLDVMFREMGLRSEVELWRVDGVGTCRQVGQFSSEGGFCPDVREGVIRLREERNLQTAGENTLAACPYFRDNQGCVLGDLKAPVCIAHVDYPEELRRRFGIDGYQLKKDIEWMLNVIQSQDLDSLKSEGFCHLALSAIGQMTNHVRHYPILGENDRRFPRLFSSMLTPYQHSEFAR